MSEHRQSPAMLRQATDTDLVAALRAGSPDAFAVIHDRYHDSLLAFARKMVHNAHHDAEEVVQDVFIRALKALTANDREIALRPWLYAITRNRALDQLRRPCHTVAFSGDELRIAAIGVDPVSLINRAERVDSLVGHLNDLPARQRQALVMLELEDRSHSQIGRVLQVSAGASKALVCRARDALGRSA